MSGASTQVRFADGTIVFSWYNGTSDTQYPALYKTWEERPARRQEMPQRERCACPPEPVVVANNYGNGCSYPATACREHLVLHSGIAPWDENIEETRGLPDWWLD